MDYKKEISQSKSLQDLENIKIKCLGRNGVVNDLLAKIRDVPDSEKKHYGQKINRMKEEIKQLLEAKRLEL